MRSHGSRSGIVVLYRLLGCAGLLASAGCANLAGVGGSADFGCQAPAGVQCESVAGNYYNALAQNLPSQRKATPSGSKETAAAATTLAPAAPSRHTLATLASDPAGHAPLRSPPRVLRLWIKSWEDNDGDLHSASYIYVPVDAGRWLVEHATASAPNGYGPTRPPGPARAAPTPPAARAGERGSGATTATLSAGGPVPSRLTAREGDRDGR